MNSTRTRTRTENRALNPDATGQLASDAPLRKTGLICIRVIAVPILILLYIGAGIPLMLRQLAHRVTWIVDAAFDLVAAIAGWDSRFWPLPKASDSRLPWDEKSSG